MEEKRDILLKLIDHPSLFLDEQSLADMKEQVRLSEDEEELDAFMEVLVEIIEKRIEAASEPL
jgi:hypothetical protein